MPDLPSPLGQPLPRREDPRLLRGLARFHDDIVTSGAVHAAFVRSPHAAARIVAIDTAPARAMPGVAAVLTGADLARLAAPFRLAPPIEGLRPVSMPPMPAETVRMVGDPVAVVLAETRAAAEEAAEQVVVAWDPTQAVASIAAAARPDAPRVDPDVPGNLVSHQRYATPGLETAFATAPRIVTARFVQHRQTHVPMEPRGCIADWDAGREHLTMTVGTQAPHPYRTALAARLGLSEAQVTIRSPDMGGGFGQKIVLLREELACAAAARLLARPVRWRESRGENLMASLHAREDEVTVRAAVTAEGTILALDAVLDQDFGAWCFFPANYMARMLVMNLPGPYRIGQLGYEVRVWLTNKCPSGPMRAPMAIVSWVTEGTIDAIARELGLDPLEVRRRNMLEASHLPYVSAAGETLDAITPRPTLDAAVAALGYDEARAAQRAALAEGRLLGIGLCAVLESTTYGSAFYRASGVPGSGHEAASVRIEPSGAVLASCGLMGSGQGYETSLAQTVAAGLGAAMRDITMQLGDTDVAPYGMGSRGARGGTAGGSALFLAGQRLRTKVLAIAADMLGLNSADGITLHDGMILRTGPTGWEKTAITLADIARRAYLDPLRLPPGMEPGLHTVAAYDPPPLTFSNSTHACLVELDRDTGEIHILRYLAAEDAGQVINPIVVAGQTQGAIALGLSGVLMERMVYDADGQPLSGSFMDYALIRAADMPAIELHHMNTPSHLTLAGIKGMAEGGVLGAVGAMMNAVNDALGQIGRRIRNAACLTRTRLERPARVSPEARPGGAAPWTPAKGRALGTHSSVPCGRGGGGGRGAAGRQAGQRLALCQPRRPPPPPTPTRNPRGPGDLSPGGGPGGSAPWPCLTALPPGSLRRGGIRATSGGRRRVEYLHVHFGPRVCDRLLHRSLEHLLTQRLFDIIEAGRGRLAAGEHLDHVPAELRVHRGLGVLARLQCESGVGEGGHHLVFLEEAEITAVGGTGVLAVFLRQGRKIGPLVQFGDDLLGFGLGRHQDVAGVHFFGAGLAGHGLLEAGAHRGLGDLRTDLLGQHRVLQHLVGGLGDLPLHPRGLFQLVPPRRDHQRAGVDHAREQHRIELLRRHAAQIGRQAGGGLLQVAQVNWLTVDRGEHRVGRGRLGRFGRTGNQRPAQGAREAGNRQAGQKPSGTTHHNS